MDESGTTRVTVEEAARLLGIERSSVKKRIQRGKLRSEKDAKGTTWVHLDESETVRDGSTNRSGTDRDDLLDAKDETISLLRDQLRLRAEEIQRRDVIISQLTQATSNLTDRLREIEAPSEPSEPTAAPSVLRETVTEGGKEGARVLAGAAAGALLLASPPALGSLISYFNGADVLAAITAMLSVVGALVGVYFGVRVTSDARDGAQAAANGADGPRPLAGDSEAQNGSEKRSMWSRIFGA